MLTDSDFTPNESAPHALGALPAPPWTVAAIGAMTLIVCLTNWWVVSRLTDSAQAREAQWQSFHREVIGDLRELTHVAGLSTSHELSPVRFRFRTESFLPPFESNSSLARLTLLGSQAMDPRTGEVCELCDFGLVPPGRYRLEVEFGAYTLDWDFDVFPGASVDRVVLCPLQPPPLGARLQVQVSPRESCRGGVCIVHALPVVRGDWAWHFRDPVVAVRDHRTSDEEISRLLEHSPQLQQRLGADAIPLVRSVPFPDSEITTAYCMFTDQDSVTACEAIHFGDSAVIRNGGMESLLPGVERFYPHRPQLHWHRNDRAPLLMVDIPQGDRPGVADVKRAAMTLGISVWPEGG